MANPFEVRVPSALEALMAGEQGYDKMRAIATDRDQSAARQEAQGLLAAGDTRGALARLIGANDPRNATVLASYENAQNGQNSVYGTPIYGTRADGSAAIGTFDKKGNFKEIATPGFQVTPGVKTIDTPQGTYVINGKSGAQVGGVAPTTPAAVAPGQPQQSPGYYPNDNRGKARDTKLGTEEGEKIADSGKARASLDTSLNSLDRMAFEADRIAKDPNLGRITGLWGVLPNMPGGGAANVNAKLETLKSQVAFGVLQAMREASKTGGALGAVSDRENQMLTSALAALDRAQSEKEFRAAMGQIKQYTEGAKQRLQQAYDTDYSQLRKPPNMQAPQAAQGQYSIPQGAADLLRQNPNLREQFDAKYGAGASQSVLGR